MAWIDAGFSRPVKRAIIALAGSPGISRGMKKLTVIAAQRVSAKNPSRCRRNLMDDLPWSTASHSLSGPGHAAVGSSARSVLRRKVQEHLLDVRQLPGRRQRVRVLLRGPTGERLGAVLVPLDALGRRDDRDVAEHGLLDGAQQLVLGRLVRRREVVQRLVDRRVAVPLVVARRGLPQRGAVGAVHDLAELVVRPGTTGLAPVGEVEVTLLDPVVEGLTGEVVDAELHAEWRQLLLDLGER